MRSYRYAQNTKVDTNTTRGQIEKLLEKQGASSFVFGQDTERAMLLFELGGWRMRFSVSYPKAKRGETDNQRKAEIRRRWRSLLLVLKAKLEAVESGITGITEEFLAHIIVQGTSTVGDRVIPGLAGQIASGGELPPLLQLGDGR